MVLYMINKVRQEREDLKTVMLERDVLGVDIDMSVFREFGDVTEYPVSTNEQIAERVSDADCIIVNKLKMDEEHLKDCPNVKLILEAATGTDNIDKEYCRNRGIKVANVEGYSTRTVAQHTFALYFYLAEHMNYYDRYVKDGVYSNQPYFAHFENYFHDIEGLTWGIVGLGEIGRAAAKIAEAFGARILCYSASGHKYDSPYEQVDFDTLLRECDVISIHAPLNEYTRNLFDRDAFSRMKKSAYLINVGRGPIVNDADLAKALADGEIAGAGIDVMGKEPIDEANPLMSIKDSDRLIITPHMAWGSVEARQRLVNLMADNARRYLKGDTKGFIV